MNQKRSLLGGLAKSLGGKAAGSTDVQGALTGEPADHQLWKCLHPAGIRPLCSSTPLCPERRLPLLHHLPNTPAGFPALAASLMPPGLPLHYLDSLLPSSKLLSDAAYPGLCPDLEPCLTLCPSIPASPSSFHSCLDHHAGHVLRFLLDVSLPMRMLSSPLVRSILTGALELCLPTGGRLDGFINGH